MSKILKNNTAAAINLDIGHVIPASGQYTIDPANYSLFARSDDVITKLAVEDLTYNDGSVDLSTIDALLHLSGFFPSHIDATVDKTPPFAEPLYRTKLDATDDVVACPINDVTTIEYKMLSEKYVSGGCMIIENAEFGDYISADVYDKDGVIPEAYRAALCEAWPIVSTYVIKQFVETIGGTLTKHRIDTKPLNAKITQNLYLRISYSAINSGAARGVAINYDLTKKL